MKQYVRKLQRTYGKAFLHLSSVVAGVVFLGLAAQAATNYRATNGGTTVVTEFSVCKSIVNNSGYDLFIPTNSGGEWSAFYNNPPSGVAINQCVSPPSIAISPTNYSYGTVNENGVVTGTFTVTNSGGPGVLSTALAIQSGLYALGARTCPADGGTMGGNSSCTINVSYTGGLQCGGSAISRTATLTVTVGASSASASLIASNTVHPLTYASCR